MSFNVSLFYGMRKSGEVTKLQSALKKLGYYKYPEITGNYLNETCKAVLNFQEATGVVKFGIESGFGAVFGPKSRQALNLLLSK